MTCRICYDNEPLNLIQPCGCRGTLGHVHLNCLNEWIRKRPGENCYICELCHQPYDKTHVPRSLFRPNKFDYAILMTVGIMISFAQLYLVWIQTHFASEAYDLYLSVYFLCCIAHTIIIFLSLTQLSTPLRFIVCTPSCWFLCFMLVHCVGWVCDKNWDTHLLLHIMLMGGVFIIILSIFYFRHLRLLNRVRLRDWDGPV